MTAVSYTVTPIGVEFPLRIYDFLIASLREIDQTDGARFVERFMKGPQRLFENFVGDIDKLASLRDLFKCPDAHLKHLAPIVGWTREKTFARLVDSLDAATLRRLISVSGSLWRSRGPEAIILDAIRVVSPARARIMNWFDFRWNVGEDALGEGTWLVGSSRAQPEAPFISNLRIVDDGTLDRTLVKRMLNRLRAVNERFDITYLAFLDNFDVDGDDVQWSKTPAVGLKVSGGQAKLEGAAEESVTVIVATVQERSTYLVNALLTGTGDFGILFYSTGPGNFYSVRVETSQQNLKLRKVVGGVPTEIFTVLLGTALFPIVADVEYRYLITVVPEGGSNRIVVSVDNTQLISTLDSAHTKGTIGLTHLAGSKLTCPEIELIALPGQYETLSTNSML